MSTTGSVVLLLALLCPFADGRDFLGSNQRVDTASIHQAIHETLREVLGSGHNVDSRRLATINATLMPLFNSLPKNHLGRLSAPFMRYAVQRYFSQRHGWIVKGFESHTPKLNASVMVGAKDILLDEVPDFVEAIIGKTLSHGGFAMQDMIIAVASIERLIIDEVITGVELAFQLNEVPTDQILGDLTSLGQILQSFFMVEYLGGNSTDLARHRRETKKIGTYYAPWPDTFHFWKETIHNVGFQATSARNPFQKRAYAFEDVVRITQEFSEKFGPFANHECHEMKMKLSDMDVHETGRVTLANFYRAIEGGDWQFAESTEYLRMIGALDESSEVFGPQVIIPNYITGQNNCISNHLFYKVCCLNECDGVFQHLEERIGRPTGSAAEVTQAIEEGMPPSFLFSSSFPVEARNLSAPLRGMLKQIADHHGDAIPLHGRLLAQWLHYAFPRECPFPYMAGTITQMQQYQLGKIVEVTEEEVKQHLESEAGRREPSPDAGRGMWSLDEELIDVPAPSVMGSHLRTLTQIVMLGAMAAWILRELDRIRRLLGAAKASHMAEVSAVNSYYI